MDKVVFGVLLLVFFQLPLLTNEYLQLTNGYYLSTKSQVDGFKLNAKSHGYADLYEMVAELKLNATPAVRTDALQKEQTIHESNELLKAMDILKNGNIFEKALYMFAPQRWAVLREVSDNFQPGIPLSLRGFGYSLISALVLGFFIMWPIRRLFSISKKAKNDSRVKV